MGRNVTWDAAGEPDSIDQSCVCRVYDDDLLARLKYREQRVEDAVEATCGADTFVTSSDGSKAVGFFSRRLGVKGQSSP
ncbi:hypothetical protein O982_24925 [Mycobacterium avium 10-5581]|nr:hypothetical protein O982_24925 [Mycobacterium avium 10-5581]